MMRSYCQSHPVKVKGRNWDYSGRKLKLRFNSGTSTLNLHRDHISVFLELVLVYVLGGGCFFMSPTSFVLESLPAKSS